ncbi:YfhO family protein [Candidatus Mycosynbacter amalyticus]|uniref:YfhO family protein n=1 Tax=Candidatus Mycosynbacter amalyticus TaxID=2665156 RepID=A0A857MMK5_9BACT|nr:YfhO family protein [Candidatus Mycosynbacter amalyticus]QHN43328.1 YfhO family protein [Candidatus Mycosynbacter amalyticus]
MWKRYKRDIYALLVIVICIVLANSISIFLTNPNPVLKRSGLPLMGQTDYTRYIDGDNTIDPNDGYTKQALGTAAARQVQAGDMPYWNHDEGIGFPLLANAQSAALFPLTLLLTVQGGFLLFQLALELIAGVGMYLFLRKLELDRRASTVGGVLFGLCGTFAWLANAVCNPVAFLPWMLLGIEYLRNGTARTRHPLCIGVIFSLSLALSLYAGFPETAYLNGLFVLGWALVRTVGLEGSRWRYYMNLGLSGCVGLLLAAPAIVPFVQTLSVSHLGVHDGEALKHAGLSWAGLPMMFVPYVYGAMSDAGSIELLGTWFSIGGYVTFAALLLALLGMFATKYPRAVRVFLVVWAVVVTARIFAAPLITDILSVLPAMKETAVYRYLTPTVVCAVVILAAMALDHVAHRGVSRKMRYTFGAGTATFVIVIALIVWSQIPGNTDTTNYKRWLILSVGIAGVVVGAISYLVYAPRRHRRIALALVTVVVIAEAVVLFAIPQLAATKRPAQVEDGAVQFLRTNLDQQRFISFGPIQANYGSYFGIAQVNNNDLPVPTLWADHITNKLAPEAGDPVNFTGVYSTDLAKHPPIQEFLANIDEYRKIGVKYAVFGENGITEAQAASAGLVRVYDRNTVWVYELPHPAPYAESDLCTIQAQTRDQMTAYCHEAGTLVRRELFYPGWQATVDGHQVDIQQESDIFQKISLPKGESKITFYYAPPNIVWSWILCACACGILIGTLLWRRLR